MGTQVVVVTAVTAAMTGGAMTRETWTEPARRVRRPSWRDPRLGVGVLLVAGSVALGTWVVSGAADGVPVYAAREVLTPGEALGSADLAVVEARVPGAADVYLRADAPLPEDAVVTRLVGSGELVPVAAVGTDAAVDVRPVSIRIEGPMSSGVVDGALVDLWLTRPGPRLPGSVAGSAEPELVVGGLRVARVTADDQVFAGVSSTSVEVLVPRERLPSVLAALAVDGAITLVPLPGGS